MIWQIVLYSEIIVKANFVPGTTVTSTDYKQLKNENEDIRKKKHRNEICSSSSKLLKRVSIYVST